MPTIAPKESGAYTILIWVVHYLILGRIRASPKPKERGYPNPSLSLLALGVEQPDMDKMHSSLSQLPASAVLSPHQADKGTPFPLYCSRNCAQITPRHGSQTQRRCLTR
jgi:hypothetical protein